MEVADARRLKGLEEENRRLKKLLAEAMLDNAALKESWEKTAEACGKALGSGPGDRAARVEPAPRVQADRDRSFGFALSAQATERHRAAQPTTRTGRAAAALRLSQI